MAGVDLRTVQELMGHKTITMTLRYSHLSPAHKLDAVERLVPVDIEQAGDTNTDTDEIAVGDDSKPASEVSESKDEDWWRWVDSNHRPASASWRARGRSEEMFEWRGVAMGGLEPPT
jgi:hypothetical protein